MIIPLYNLQAHNVMTNVIVDAGTDAKIAKFHKRGLEIIGLAMLEVVEATRGVSWADDRAGGGNGGHTHHASMLSADGHTPASSHVSLNSDNTHESLSQPHYQPPAQTMPMSPTPQLPEKSGARRLFGKVFKKKGEPSAGGPVGVPSKANSPYGAAPTPRSPLPSLDRDVSASTKASNKRSSLLLSVAQGASVPDPMGSPAAAQTPQPQTVLGIAPIIHTAYSAPEGSRVRPTRYVWVVRKWLKGPPAGVTLPTTSGVLPGAGPMDSLVEVTFEWVRAASSRKGSGDRRVTSRSSERKEKKDRRRSSGGAASNTPSLSSLRRGRKSVDGDRNEAGLASGKKQGRARSSESARTSTTLTTDDGSPPGEDDDGEGGEDSDSDPEDSETPWMCQLVVRKLPAPAAAASHRLSYMSASDDGSMSTPVPAPAPVLAPTSVKVKVAAIVPAPHHPRVVSLLKIPFPLQDIIVTSKTTSPPAVADHRYAHLTPHIRHHHSRDNVEVDFEARKRIVTPAGVARPAVSPNVAGGGIAGSPPATPTQAAINASGSDSAGLHKLAGKFKATVSPSLGSGYSSETSVSSASVGSGGSGGVTVSGGEGILLSAEEIKDIVCCTALWVVVREAFGGVGRVSRKGDGWRIRG